MSLNHSAAILWAFSYIFVGFAAALNDEIVPQPRKEIDYRLPVTIKPSAYNITLRPYLLEGDAKRFTFDGEVYINITTSVAIGTLVLHAKDINFTLSEYWSTLTPNDRKSLQDPIPDEVTDKITFNFNSTLTVGTIYTIHFKYAGSMSDDTEGFYRSSYKDQHNVTKWLGATQFESYDARRAFPSFDEPKFKATFDVTIIRHKSMKSLSNARLIGSTCVGDYYIDAYDRTPPMSSYLLAFIVSEFTERTDGTFGIITRPEYYDQTEYSFTVGKQILSAFDKYLKMPYYEQGIDKMQIAAIPGFDPDGMENWGLIIYGEETPLYDNKSTTLKYKEFFAAAIAHEQAHMWFGNIVTCDWWSYLWLNEGFATFFQYEIVAKIEPEFQSDKQFVVNELQNVMGLDSTNSTNPMSDENTNSQSDLNRAFNSISYSKGGSVIRMIRYAMGEENFQKSLQEYLTTYKYQTTVPNNLLKIWEKHWPDTTRNQAPLVFRSFTEQVGYPVVTVNVADDGKSMTLNQTRFLLIPTDGSNATLMYTVPFTYTTSLEKDFNATEPKFYLEASKATKTETFTESVNWVIGNIQETGYYRVNYDTRNWHKIHQALLTSDWGGIHELNRAQIVDDLFQFARANVIDYDLALEILEYLETELNYMPWTAAFNGYSYLTTRLGTDTKNFGIYLCQLLEKAYNQFGFDEKSTDTALDIYVREMVLSWSCKYGNKKCISEAMSRFAILHSSPVPVNIRLTVYCTVMREGTETDFNILFNKYKSETIPTEQKVILYALGCVREQKLVEKFFNIIISDDVGRQDKDKVLTFLFTENNENVSPVFDLVTKNFEKLAESIGDYDEVSNIISGIASRFTEESQEKKLKDFNTANKAKFGVSAATLVAAEKTVAENLAWSSDRMGAFKQYFEKRARAVPAPSVHTQYRH